MQDAKSPDEIFEHLGRALGLPNIVEIGLHFQKREKWITDSESWLEQQREREAFQKSQPDRFYRWSHE